MMVTIWQLEPRDQTRTGAFLPQPGAEPASVCAVIFSLRKESLGKEQSSSYCVSAFRELLVIRGKWVVAASPAAMLLALSACGGGGGSSSPAPLPPPPTAAPPPAAPPPTSTPAPTPTTNYDTAEYERSNAAVAANAISAYNAGATGVGVKIGIVDTGINPALAEFAGKVDPASKDVAASRGVSDEDGHGSAVADIAAGAKNDSGIHGVAFNSTIVALRADDPGTCAMPKTDTGGGCQFNDTAIAAGIDAARTAGVRVINLSLGGSAPGTQLLAAMSRATGAGIVLVISAGNDGAKPEGANADPFALVPAQQGSGNVIIAGSIGVDDGVGGTDLNQLSTFSNKAGTGAAWYLTALGYRDRAVDNTGASFYWSGTSFSAPTIAGAVALLAQAFPNLTGQQIVSILFNSADPLGTGGVNATFGHGRLNLQRAFAPQGTLSLADSKIAISAAQNGNLPAAAGDAASKGSMGAIVLDGYSRAYALNLAKTLRVADQLRPLERALAGRTQVVEAVAGRFGIAMTVALNDVRPREVELSRLGIGPNDARRARLIAGSAIARVDDNTAAAFGFAEGAKAMERRLSGASDGAFLIARDALSATGFSAQHGSSMALRRRIGPVGVTISAETGHVWKDIRTSAAKAPYRYVALEVDKTLSKTRFSLGLSRLTEHDTLLGGQIGTAFGGGSGSNTTFLDLEARRPLGSNWSAGLAARRGWTKFGAGSFQSDAYAFDLMRSGLFSDGDRFGLRLAQPLRIASGGFAALLPTGYDYATQSAETSLERFSLSPTGREVDAELSYGRPVVSNSGWFGGNLFARRQPGHIASAPNDVGGAVRWSLGF